MTHFLLIIRNNKKNYINKKIKQIFSRSKCYEEFEKSNYQLIIGDLYENNYQIKGNNDTFELQTNKIKNPIISDGGKKEVDSYGPNITVDSLHNHLSVKTDPFGLEYVFAAITQNNDLLLSSHLKYIVLAEPTLIEKIDYDAAIEYIFGHFALGYKTLFKSIKLLPYNAHIQITDWESDLPSKFNLALHHYDFWYAFPTDYNENLQFEEQRKKITTIFKQVINRLYSTNSTIPTFFFLTGGFDSRLNISLIEDKKKKRSKTLTYDTSDPGLEINKARQVSELLDIEHAAKIVGVTDVCNNYIEHFWISEGYTNHIASILHPFLEEFEKPYCYVDGYMGGTQFGGRFFVDIDKALPKYEKRNERLFSMLQTHNFSFPFKDFVKITKEGKNNIKNLILQGIKQHTTLMWPIDNEIMDLECQISQIRGRGYVNGNPLTMDQYAPVVKPYYHPLVFTNFVKLHHKYRRKSNLHKTILQDINPELLELDSTAKKWFNRVPFAKKGLKILQKVESITRLKIIPQYMAIPLEEWMKNKQYQETFIDPLIFNEDSIIWTIIDKKKTQKMFREFDKHKNHLEKFLMHIIDLELTFRTFYSITDIKTITTVSDFFDKNDSYDLKINLDYIRNALRKFACIEDD